MPSRAARPAGLQANEARRARKRATTRLPPADCRATSTSTGSEPLGSEKTRPAPWGRAATPASREVCAQPGEPPAGAAGGGGGGGGEGGGRGPGGSAPPPPVRGVVDELGRGPERRAGRAGRVRVEHAADRLLAGRPARLEEDPQLRDAARLGQRRGVHALAVGPE